MDPTIIAALVDRNKRLPMYMQLAQSLEEMIRSGKLQAGDVVPTEAEFCQSLHISAVTVKKGLGVLVKKELIRRIPGRGSFVSEKVGRTQQPSTEKTVSPPAKGLCVLMASEKGEEFSALGSWHSRIAEGFEAAVSRHHGNVRYLPWPGDSSALDDPAWDGVSGVAIFERSPAPARCAPIWCTLAKKGVPAVCVSYCWCSEDHDNVCFSQTKMGQVTAMHLVSAGYNRFIIAREQAHDRSNEERYNGFINGLDVAGAGRPTLAIVEAPFTGNWRELGRQLAEKMGKTGSGILSARTAIVAGTDPLAAAIAHALSAHGLACGRDYGLIGCGEEPDSRRLGISTIGFPLAKAGELAAQRLLGLLEQEPGTFRYSLWPYVLRRKSTIPPADG